MATLAIKGVPPFDGVYDLNISSFTGTELHTIKKISGVRGGELKEAFAAGDYDLVVAFTVIVLRRNGHEVEPEQIMEADVGAITVDLTAGAKAEVEERPPISAPPPGSENLLDEHGERRESTKLSGSHSGAAGV